MPVTEKTWRHLGRIADEVRDLARAREVQIVLPQAPPPVSSPAREGEIVIIDYLDTPRSSS